MTGRWLALVACLAAPAAGAHALSETTARLTLRDGHFDVVLDVDLFLLVPEGPTAVATATGEAVSGRLAALRQQLETGTRLQVDGARVPLRWKDGPSAAAFQAAAAVLSASGMEHGERFRVGLDAVESNLGAREVALEVPAGLGPVVVSFVEPVTAYLPPGGQARFTVRARPAETREEAVPRADSATGAGALLLGLVGTAALAIYVRKQLGDGA